MPYEPDIVLFLPNLGHDNFCNKWQHFVTGSKNQEKYAIESRAFCHDPTSLLEVE
jgi:hypothetical protein